MDSFNFEPAYTAQGWSSGIAWRVYAYETEPTEETIWSGYEEHTGRVLAHMVGDDRTYAFDPEDLAPLNDHDYCSCCGQVGCMWGAAIDEEVTA